MVKALGRTGLSIGPLVVGGNVFGWTIDEKRSFEVLDAFFAGGATMIDTADVYYAYAPGNVGGESETIIGRWMKERGNRDRVQVATKVGLLEVGGAKGLQPAVIEAAVEASLRRLGTDYVDLYFAHSDDESVPQEEYLDAFDALVRSGKVRAIAASNFTADRLRSALEISRRDGLAEFVALQPHYNLVERADFETSLAPLLESEGLSCLPYYGLAKGFLTGKYRDGGPEVDSPRAEGARAYLDDRGRAVLAVLDEIAAGHGVPVAAVALGWLTAQPTVAAPIASARNTDQLAGLLPVLDLELTDDEVRLLSHVSA